MNKFFYHLFGVLAFCLLSQDALAQGPQWWSENVQWDGITPFENYINLTSTGMGPNALPIPDNHGQWDTLTSFTLTGVGYFRSGETTLNSHLDLRWQATSAVRLRIHLVPLEWYTTSHELKTMRKVHFLSYNQQWAGGDIYVESSIKLPEKWVPVQSELRVGIKTASGTNLGAARYTDTPGYFFDLASFGHIPGLYSLEWEAMLGFYAYQTYDDKHRQNDCVLYGGSLGWSANRWSLRGEVRGYWGYFNMGDRPLVASLDARLGAMDRPWQLILKGGVGLHDWPFSSVHLGLRRMLNP